MPSPPWWLRWTRATPAPFLLAIHWRRIHAASPCPPPGTPYPRAFDLLVRVYEGGTYDRALLAIMQADPVRGPAYVRDVFERSERTPLCFFSRQTPECVDGYLTFHQTTWCKAGRMLFMPAVYAVTPGLRMNSVEGVEVPDGLPEHVQDWIRRCQ